ncbi:hypothetical protein [Methanoculleus nereidis]|uniref:hypothetical protein n=1 Tax=Methanoculleus nereidis TaxID=2735141 RepID=UPI00294336C2|nr:hypothetical protein [Methanoculleus sp. YWC-01]
MPGNAAGTRTQRVRSPGERAVRDLAREILAHHHRTDLPVEPLCYTDEEFGNPSVLRAPAEGIRV